MIRITIMMVAIIAAAQLYGQPGYKRRLVHEGSPVVAGEGGSFRNVVFWRDTATAPEPEPEPADTFDISMYYTQDFNSIPTGVFDSADIHDYFNGTNWASSYKGGGSRDSMYIVDFAGDRELIVGYAYHCVGTYRDYRCDYADPPNCAWLDGSGEHFYWWFEDTPANEKTDDMWYQFDTEWETTPVTWQAGGKCGLWIGGGSTDGQPASRPPTNGGFDFGLVWPHERDWDDDSKAPYASYNYYYSMSTDFAVSDMWDGVDGDGTGDTAWIVPGTEATITVRVKINTFTGGTANADGFMEAWYNGQMVKRITGLRILHGSQEGRGFNRMQLSYFFGGAALTANSENHTGLWYDNIHTFDVTNNDVFGGADTIDRSFDLPLTNPNWPKNRLNE